MSKFCGLRSRCRTLWLWQNARPRRSWYIKDFTISGSISPFRLSKYFFRSWSQCSNTRVNFLSLCRTSYSRTMFLCFSSFSKQISRKADDGTPYESFPWLNTIQVRFLRKFVAKKTKRTASKFHILLSRYLPHHRHQGELSSMQQFHESPDSWP
jgi:hypothetical protein